MLIALPGGHVATLRRRVRVVADLVVSGPDGTVEVFSGVPEAEAQETLRALREALAEQISQGADAMKGRAKGMWYLCAGVAVGGVLFGRWLVRRLARRAEERARWVDPARFKSDEQAENYLEGIREAGR